ncbi:MATE family efflux transporter [symbiont of Argiope bruennichi]|uniref:MATE family efflux transporter n=1 Tax=symbiont of Argiope bruennichi TaxID=2810479 RepID=UPI003DA5736C
MSFFYKKKLSSKIDTKITMPFFKKALFAILPVAFQSFIEVAITIIDTLLVGNTNDAATNIQAIGSVNAIFYVYFSILIGLLNGTGIFVTQFFGAKKFKEMRYVIRYRIFISILFYLFYLLLIFSATNFLINLTLHNNDPSNVLPHARKYLFLNSISYGFVALSFAIHWTLRDTKRLNIPFYVSVWNLIVKVCLSLVLVYIFNLGILGISYTNIVVRVLEFLMLLFIINYKKFEFNYQLWNIFGFTKKTLIDVNRRTWIFTLNEVLWSTSILLQIFSFTLLKHNDQIIQSVQISFTIIDLAFAAIFGISGGISTLVGIKLGENKLDEAFSNSLKLNKIGFYIAICMGSILIISSPFVAFVLFSKVSHQVKIDIICLLIIDGLCLPLFSAAYCHFFTIRLGGDTKSILLMDGTYSIFIVSTLNIALCYLTSIEVINLSFISIYVIVYLVISFKTFITTKMYYKKKWLKNLTNINY